MQIPVLPVFPCFQFSHNWWHPPMRTRVRQEQMDIEGGTVHDWECTRKHCDWQTIILCKNTHRCMYTHIKCVPINPYIFTVQTQPYWKKWFRNIKTTLGSVSSLWTLCVSTTWALYISPDQSALYSFHPPTPHVICVILLFVLFSGYCKAVGKTHTQNHVCDAPRADSGNFIKSSAWWLIN